MTKRAALYARFSTDLQHDRSIDDQFALCEALAKREGWIVVQRFSDYAKSSTTLYGRTGLADLMEAAQANAFDVLIVESLDRVSRAIDDLGYTWKRLRYAEVAVHTVNEGLIDNLAHVGLRGTFGEMFIQDLRDKTRRGLNGRARAGKVPGSVPYGYRIVEDRPGEPEINQEQAAIIRRIYAEYVAGQAPRSIALGLTKDGIPSPTGGSWRYQNLTGGGGRNGVLSNPLYIGQLVWNKSRKELDPYTGKKKARHGKPEDRIVTEVPHLRIVDQALWDAAQRVRADRALVIFGPDGKPQQRGRQTSDKHLLTSLLRCGACGGGMRIVQRSRDGHARVACKAAHQHNTCSHTRSYDLTRLEDAVLDGMRVNLTDPRRLADLARGEHAKRAERQKHSRADAASIRQQLGNKQTQINRTVAAITAIDGADVPELSARLRALDSERVSLAERLRLIEADTNVVDILPHTVEAYKDNVERLYAALKGQPGIDPVAAQFAFRNLMDSIVIHPTAKRMPYEFTPYGRLSAIMGVELFPAGKTAEEIVKQQGFIRSDIGGIENPAQPISKQGIVSLGRWRAAA